MWNQISINYKITYFGMNSQIVVFSIKNIRSVRFYYQFYCGCESSIRFEASAI